jgi:SET domain-containing protein
MFKKQSTLLKKGSKKGTDKARKLSPNTKQLPDHHFKLVKVKKGIEDMGLFAGEPIKKGELIIEYIGNIITTKEANELKENEYLFEVNRLKTIDGSPKWNIARYCNHACADAANAESDLVKGRVFVRAIKNIAEGEEILYDYGEEFVTEHIMPYGCRCSAKKHAYTKE